MFNNMAVIRHEKENQLSVEFQTIVSTFFFSSVIVYWATIHFVVNMKLHTNFKTKSVVSSISQILHKSTDKSARYYAMIFHNRGSISNTLFCSDSRYVVVISVSLNDIGILAANFAIHKMATLIMEMLNIFFISWFTRNLYRCCNCNYRKREKNKSKLYLD